ncbi:glycoside hydrolase family 32 protein [Enterococcus faecium]|uniref:Sucrose-6-phosphate hydrolase n=1 Tax=Enterococcus faecium 10/96A TaxID=1391465 RepID=A0AAV3L0B7_ENTFC|nr:glycoside hydrolase family 32 protein [Enterococcus faecium]EFF25457.1 levanase [Enterococcus faecium E1679]ERT50303.1 hypothetical protein O991_01764 [Enterococcus faecium 10/96A]
MSLLSDKYWKNLKDAQEDLRTKVKQDYWRLHFHQMPETGWLNDPNGACQVDGVYHLYHQYIPNSPSSGTPHWAHKTSKDLVHFKEEEIFLSPEHDYEKDGVYSGSAFVKDGEIHYFYTGNVKNEGPFDYIYDGREQNTVHAVSKDGFTIDYQKVVIPHEKYPEQYSDHIRDPKVFERNGKYYMILGARTVNHQGEVLLYVSDDLYEWEYKGAFFGDEPDLGFMWECPDYFELDGRSVLILSPQGLSKQETRNQNVYQSGFYIGDISKEDVRFEAETPFEELDYGFDFYAPQSFTDEQGRQILWGWMGIGDIKPEYANPTVHFGWQHCLTLPRQLTIENNQLKQRPIMEYQKLREDEITKIVDTDGETNYPDIDFEVAEMILNFEEIDDNFEMHVREDTVIKLEKGILSLIHGKSGSGRSVRKVEVGQLTQLHIFSDTSSLELFINDGSHVMSSRVYPKKGQGSVTFKGNQTFEMKKWNLNRTTE